MYAVAMGPDTVSTCPQMWFYSRAETRWLQDDVQALPGSKNDQYGSICFGSTRDGPQGSTVMPSLRVDPNTFTDDQSGLMFLFGGIGCPTHFTDSSMGPTPYVRDVVVAKLPRRGEALCQFPEALTDMWAFVSAPSPSPTQRRWISVFQEDASGSGTECQVSGSQWCGSGLRAASLITANAPSDIPVLIPGAADVTSGSVFLFGGHVPNTRLSSSVLWKFSYSFDRGEDVIVGRWSILAMQRVANSTRKCTLGFDGSLLPDQICDICDVAPCPHARVEAAAWSGGNDHNAVGWIFGGYDGGEGVLFNDLWQLNSYETVVGPTQTDPTLLSAPAGQMPGISRSQPLWRQIAPAQPHRFDSAIGLWPPVADFSALGSSTRVGALWMLAGYGSLPRWAASTEPELSQEHSNPTGSTTLWSFEISTGVWSRVEAVQRVPLTTVEVHWPAARTDASVIGGYGRSSPSSGVSRGAFDAAWVLGGFGNRECSGNLSASSDDVHELTGLWRLEVLNDQHELA
eukprot:COSAG02_NODE_5380_length_4381_cov_2.299159_4_plen_514_part_00